MKKLFNILFILFISLCYFSCASNKEIPTDLTAAQYLQKGQAAYNNQNYSLAEKYYLQAIDQYGYNTEIYIESKYELGHLYIQTKQYDKAYEIFTEILEIYDYAAINDLPPAYKKLANIELNKIPKNQK